MLQANGADSVFVMPVVVPAWTRGTQCTASVEGEPLRVTALGGSVSTPGDSGLTAPCVVVCGGEELAELPREATEGRIVLFNRPMDPLLINTGAAYGGAVDQRAQGAVAAAKAGNGSGLQVVGAMESDAGGLVPRGFSIDAGPEHVEWLQSQLPALEPYGLHTYRNGWAGVDISPLKRNDPRPLLIGLLPDNQRYFDYHHSARDVFENVHKRELELGAAACALMMVMLDQHL